MALFFAPCAFPVRPFITDDARVVGERLGQLESWVRGDRHALEHWALVAYGPVEPLELTLGAVHGIRYEAGTSYIFAGPLVQAKYLMLTPKLNRRPGVAISVGGTAPVGTQGFASNHWDAFAYAALTESLWREDRILVHGNLGIVKPMDGSRSASTWGLGSQIRVRGGFHGVGEIFSGDPYAEGAGRAIQLGFRHFFNDRVQVDGTWGVGIAGTRMPAWATVGIRIVTPPLGRETFRALKRKR